MNIDKAIEIKSRIGEEFLLTDPDDIDEAERLSNEAMKREKKNRIGTFTILLPGETAE